MVRVTVGYSDTFLMSQECHCNQLCLCSEIIDGIPAKFLLNKMVFTPKIMTLDDMALMSNISMDADTPSMFVEMCFNIWTGKFVKSNYIKENLVEC